MRLLLITQDFPPNTGGIETYCFELAKRFRSHTDYFSVLAPAHRDSGRVDEALDFPVIRLPVANSLLPLAGFWAIAREARRHRIDTVFLAQWQSALAALAARRLTGYPRRIFVAAHARELFIDPFSGRSGWWSRRLYGLRKRIFRRVDGFFPVSRYTATVLRDNGVPGDRIHVVGNGTDPRHFRPRDTAGLRRELGAEGKKVIFTICRLVRRKGIDLVMQALRGLARERDDLLYLVGGTGPEEERLRALAGELDLRDEVRFLGRVDGERLPEFYSLADVFVMPARHRPPDVEGFGIVFLEASACGVPVVGSRSGGIPDAIREGETGLIVEEGSVEELREALRGLLEDPQRARRMGERGRRHVQEKATWDHVSKRLLEVMNGLAFLLAVMVLLAAARPASAQGQAMQEGDVRWSVQSSLHTSSADSLPFWFYSNQLGRVHPEGTQTLNEFSARSVLLDRGRWRLSASGRLLARLAGRSSLHFPELYLQADYGPLRLNAGRFALPIGLNNHRLSAGAMMEGINATPVPRVTVYTPEFMDVPGTQEHVQVKGLYAHGWFPDRRFVNNVMLHQKYFYLRLNAGRWSGTGGIVHNSTWGGTHPQDGKMPSSFGDYLRVVFAYGGAPSDSLPPGEISNSLGNSVASYEFGLTYRGEGFRVCATRLFYLEDSVSRRFRSPWDGVWGLNITREGRHWVDGITYEHINTKQQDSRADQPSGRQMYYWNFIYQSGWTHEDRVLGIPLITFRPDINRPWHNIIVAHHLGVSGQPGPRLAYRLLGTYSRNYSTFERRRVNHREDNFRTLEEMKELNLSLLLDLSYAIPGQEGLSAQLSLGADFGEQYGDILGIRAGLRWDGSF